MTYNENNYIINVLFQLYLRLTHLKKRRELYRIKGDKEHKNGKKCALCVA